jgi:thioredoxin 1
VTAFDEVSGGARHSITIANEKGRLSKDQIEAMLAEAEKFAADDKAKAQRLEWFQNCENLVCSLRNTMQSDEIAGPGGIENNKRETIMQAVNAANDWLLGEGAAADMDTLKAKVKELEAVSGPILSEFYAARAMKPSAPGAAAAAAADDAAAAGDGGTSNKSAGGGGVTEITSEAEFRAALSQNKVLVADAKAEWCGPCKMAAPQYAQLASNTRGAKFVTFDVDKVKELAQSLKIEGMPTFLVFRDGKEVARVQGADMAKVKAAVEAAVNDQTDANGID